MCSRSILYLPAESMSQTTLYHHENKQQQEETAVAGLDQHPPVQWRHKRHKGMERRAEGLTFGQEGSMPTATAASNTRQRSWGE